VFGLYGKPNEHYVYGPGYWDFDISLLKNVRISDRFRLQFRAEAFNHANSLVGDNKSLQACRTRSVAAPYRRRGLNPSTVYWSDAYVCV